MAADEIEGAIIQRIGMLVQEEGLLDGLTAAANRRLQYQEPPLLKQQRILRKKLDELKANAEKVLAEWSPLEQHAGRAFLTEKLSDLAQQRVDVERGFVEVEGRLAQVRSRAITAEQVRAALAPDAADLRGLETARAPRADAAGVPSG